MRKSILAILAVALLASACSKTKKSTCGEQICTANFAYIMISFLDKDGNPTEVKDYHAINLRTKDTVKSMVNVSINTVPGTFAVVDDSHITKLSDGGDDIEVSATSVTGNQTKKGILKVSGGKCACHITKVSGPDQIKFD
ncbi:hypothetical protein GCM10023149_32010 [Mucilaginibacter gynuensis]|uniref:Tissue inhibitor of metalloproteinase n=1 Tax=Mucilaginibacter gynuensis TaxID=1302236 RepID=A0ABP8GPQ8_9SPHI